MTPPLSTYRPTATTAGLVVAASPEVPLAVLATNAAGHGWVDVPMVARLDVDHVGLRDFALMTQATRLDQKFAKRRLATLSGDAVDYSDDRTGDHQ